jgi:hypothetical protein
VIVGHHDHRPAGMFFRKIFGLFLAYSYFCAQKENKNDEKSSIFSIFDELIK